MEDSETYWGPLRGEIVLRASVRVSRYQKGFWTSSVRRVKIAVSFTGSSCLGVLCFNRKAKEKKIPFDCASCIYGAYRSNVLYASDIHT